MAWYEESEQPKAYAEAAIIVDAFAANGIDIGGVLTEDGWIEYMYAEGQFLAREQYLESVREALGDRAELVVERRVVQDILLLRVHFPGDSGDRSADGDAADEERSAESERQRPALVRLLDHVDATLGPGIATLNHVVTTAPGGSPHGCPATEPQEVYDRTPYPPLCPGDGGDRVRVWVADTGLVADTVSGCGWLSGVTGDPDPSVDGSGTILPYGAHGTFVAGVIRAMAPAADIVVKCVFDIAGSALESDFVPKLYEGFGFGADIFHITVASQTRKNLPLMAFEAWLRDLRSHKGVACVVPAGNNDSRHPCCAGRVPRHRLGRGPGDRLAQPGVLQQLRRLGRRVRAGREPRQRLRHRHVHLPGPAVYRAGQDILRDGAVERDFFLDPHRDRAHRGPDGAPRGKRSGGGRRPAGQGARPGDSRCGPGSVPRLRRRRRALQSLRRRRPLRSRSRSRSPWRWRWRLRWRWRWRWQDGTLADAGRQHGLTGLADVMERRAS